MPMVLLLRSYAKAWDLVEPEVRAFRTRDRERFGDLLSAGISVEKPEEVIAAASLGRIDTLWVAKDDQDRNPVIPICWTLRPFVHSKNGGRVNSVDSGGDTGPRSDCGYPALLIATETR
jgi:hypothetical protein